MGGRPSRSISSAPTSAGSHDDAKLDYELQIDLRPQGLPSPVSLRLSSRSVRVGRVIMQANTLLSRLSIRAGEICGFESGQEALDCVLCDSSRPFPCDLLISGSLVKPIFLSLTPRPLADPRTHPDGLEDYKIIRCIGEGASCVVALARSKVTGRLVALKLLGKDRILASRTKRLERALQEREVLMKLGGENFIVECYESFQTAAHLVLVLELCAGGELFYHVSKQKFKEHEVKFYVCEIVHALEYLHKNNVLFRDLKSENVLLDVDGHIRLADMGLSKTIEAGRDGMELGQQFKSFVGTIGYLPPEMIKKEAHGKPLDFYCLGCLMFLMLCGSLPYYSGSWNEMFDRRVRGDRLNFPAELSADVRDFVQTLLHADPSKRLGARGAEEVKKHAWLRGVDWGKVRRKELDPPVKPLLNKTNFAPEFTGKDIHKMLADAQEVEHFPEWDSARERTPSGLGPSVRDA